MNKYLKISLIVVVVAISVGLRIFASQTLPINADESVYLNSGLEYASYIREGEWTWLAWNSTNYEHPVLNKIIYGIVLLGEPPVGHFFEKDVGTHIPIENSEARPWIMTGRYTSLFFGSLAILALAILNPLAGLFLGIDTLSIQYTSVMYLEALPVLFSSLAVLCYLKFIGSQARGNKPLNYIWLALSSLSLGVTAASKYIYSIAGIAILIHFIIWSVKNKTIIKNASLIFGWGLLSLAFFLVFDPYLWPHPIERLVKSLTFHTGFSTSINVSQFNFTIWQPFKWLIYSVPPSFSSNPSSYFINVDLAIAILALIGLPKLFTHHRLYFIWLIVGFIALLAWPSKWPQYPMIIMVPFCLSAALGTSELISLGKKLLLKLNLIPLRNER